MIKKVDSNNFDEEIKKGVVLADFYAVWCPPCKMMEPALESFAKDNEDIKVIKVNIDAEPMLANMFNIMSIPTLILFKDGKVVDTKLGFMTADMLNDWIAEKK